MKVKLNRNQNDNQILLSIGMIVKNEERHLENCMKALLPLREQIPSELIIVDTGSTDRTIEIAKKYADKFLEFEWCNDFAAARNCGLERATGKWFMFLDADEYFDEDISEMVNFFKYPELYEKYNSASYIIRNYSDDTKKYYSDFLGSRMVKLTSDIKFKGEIHEFLPMYYPHGYFTTFVHHYGYVFKNKNQKDTKDERNLKPLLEEYEKNPESPRTLCHLCDVTYGEEKAKYLTEWLEICRKGKGSIYRNHCYKAYIKYLGFKEEYEKAEKIYEEYMDLDGVENAACTIQIHKMIAYIYYLQKKFEKSYEFYAKYFEMYRKYLDGKIDIEDLRSSAIQAVNPCEYQDSVLNASHCLFKLDRDDDALNLLKEISVKNIDFARFKIYSEIISTMADTSERFKYVADFYERTLETKDSDKINIASKQIEKQYFEISDNKLEFAKEISKINSDDVFVSIMKLIAEQENPDITEKIQKVLDSVENWEGGYSELVYLAMKYNADMSNAIDKMSYDQVRSHFPVIASVHDDFAEVVLEYADIDNFTSSIRHFFWIVSALETAVLSANELDDNQKHDLYYTFIYTLSDYVLNIYNPELLNENDVEVMPPLHRFGYYMSCALMAKDNGNNIAYIRCIKNALKGSEPLKDLVSFLIEEFEKEIK